MLLHVLFVVVVSSISGTTPAPCPNAYTPANIVNPVLPNIPQEALDTGLQHATALFRVSLDARGRPHDVEIQRSSNYADLDRAARNLAEHSQYDPEVRGCAPTSGSYTLKVDFDVMRKDPKNYGGGIDILTHAFLIGTSCPTDHGVILAHASALPPLTLPGNPSNSKEGPATVLVSVDANGNVTGASVQSSTGSPELDRAALKLAENGQYLPAVYGCKSVGETYQYVAIFHRS